MREIVRISIIAAVLMLAGCGSRSRGNDALERIDSLSGSDAALAIDMLGNIDYDDLSEKDRHRYDLLSIKCRDKNYERHTSDSLILDVIDYYSGHRDSSLYPEALYYGGRVYSDIGDLPLALEYFQKALDEIPESKDNMEFRGIVHSQTGRLLDDMRLPSEAVPHIKESIRISKRLNDDLGIAYDSQLLGGIYIHMKEYGKAKASLKEATEHSNGMNLRDRATISSYLASIYFFENKIDSALSIIRSIPIAENRGLSDFPTIMAAKIYLAADIKDSAYLYARSIAFNKASQNRKAGFSLMLSEKLRPYIPQDSLEAYLVEYNNTIETYMNTHEAQSAFVKVSRFNYSGLLQRAEEAEDQNRIFLNGIIIVLTVFFLCGSVFLYQNWHLQQERKTRNKTLTDIISIIDSMYDKEIVKIKSEYNDIKSRYDELTIEYSSSILKCTEMDEEIRQLKDSITDIKTMNLPDSPHLIHMKKDLMAKAEEKINRNEPYILPPRLRDSEIFRILTERASVGKPISEPSLWKKLEDCISEANPGVKFRLETLTENKLTGTDWQITMLIICCFSPSEMANILGISRSSISSRRKTLADKISPEDSNVKKLDRLIQCI